MVSRVFFERKKGFGSILFLQLFFYSMKGLAQQEHMMRFHIISKRMKRKEPQKKTEEEEKVKKKRFKDIVDAFVSQYVGSPMPQVSKYRCI